ncbi:MAG: membrane dipeptidase [Ruminococcaceae bacterium]|nr:membrane dipeptidase [Oscillospiraceae bacterium]
MNFFDLHCDTAFECTTQLGGRTLDEGAHHLSLDRGAYLDRWRQVFAIFMPDEDESGAPIRGDAAIAHYERVLAYIKRQAQLFPDRFFICTDRETIERETPAGVCGAIISVEGGSAAAGSLERIERMYADGVRMMTLTWNAANEIACGVWAEPTGGLTPFGRQAVELMNRIGMTVDVSHLADRGFYDVAELTQRPFVASHSCSRELCNHRRNLTDEMFGIIRDCGGLVGINFSRGFLEVNENAHLDHILRHTEHFLALGGEQTVCMGSDFDGTDMPDGVTGIESMGAVYERFLKAGYSQQLTDDIFYNNAARFFGRALS